MRKSLSIIAVALLGTLACGGDDGPEQSAECKKYVACVNATMPEIRATVDAAYGADGTCWQTDDSARLCTAYCTDGLTQIRGRHPDESACR
ncbi:hypothetical protein [Myxococcus sp. RHSTA-1-4]|uniref:hypothetical protein n=1 Tax=Myxococcus sp. RHSTA-1-4 TaxID=2874601 RepID=UPI001CC0D116|nr:hypothetical protein [Myxococcus sp. RHSTA-1-4]MBZ4421900.1 hypothetical protein [Myxococcus sp. RHSTA-1-4]